MMCFLGMTSSGSGKSGPDRFVTRLSSVTNQWLGKQRLLVEIDPWSGDPSGPREKDYRSYIKMLAKTKIPIVIALWDGVAEVDKNLLWQHVLVCLLKAIILFIILVNT